MSEVERMADQLNRSFYGTAWHGPSVIEALEGVTAELSSARPLAEGHTIRELTDHIAFWAEVVNRVIQGIEIDLNKEIENDWPEIVDNSEQAWEKSKADLKATHESIMETVKNQTEDDLSRIVMGIKNKYNVYEVTHGVTQHNLYHAGQIVLLKKGA